MKKNSWDLNPFRITVSGTTEREVTTLVKSVQENRKRENLSVSQVAVLKISDGLLLWQPATDEEFLSELFDEIPASWGPTLERPGNEGFYLLMNENPELVVDYDPEFESLRADDYFIGTQCVLRNGLPEEEKLFRIELGESSSETRSLAESLHQELRKLANRRVVCVMYTPTEAMRV